MLKVNKRIEIVRSNKLRLSSMSRNSAQAILETLSKKYTSVKITMIENLEDLELLVVRGPDLVFLGMKFIPDESRLYSQPSAKIWITEYLDKHGITYTGSGKLAHQISVEKSLAKQALSNVGLNTAAYFVVDQNSLSTWTLPVGLDYPLFVKPSNLGGGLGIDSKSVVNNLSQLRAKVNHIASLGCDALVEKYLPGREFSVSILKNELTNDLEAMPIELVAQPNEFGQRLLTGSVKSANSETVLLIDDPTLRLRINKFALESFSALDGRDFGRIDIRLDENGVPNFLEANLIPSLISGYGSFPKACMLNSSMDYETMLFNIVELAFSRELLPSDIMTSEVAKFDYSGLPPKDNTESVLPV